MKVGIGKASLWGTWKTEHALADGMDVRALMVVGEDAPAAILVADIQGQRASTCLRLRAMVASELNIAADRVGIFSTQNHGAPYETDGVFEFDDVSAAFLQATREARESLLEVEVAAVTVHPSPALNVCRRLPCGNLGSFTFWYGHDVLSTGKAEVSHLLEKALSQLRAGIPRPFRAMNYIKPKEISEKKKQHLLPAAADDAAQALFFRTPDGDPVGSLCRFAAHPALANGAQGHRHSADYPFYLREKLESVFGGKALFFTGPCGDQCFPLARKSLEAAREAGEQLADAVLEALPAAEWHRSVPVTACSPKVVLNGRKEYRLSTDEALKRQRELDEKFKDMLDSGALATPEGLAAFKKLTDLYELLGYAAHQRNWREAGLQHDQWEGGLFEHPLFVLQIGKSVLAGLPGEPFGAYSARLRKETLGDDLFVLEEANGYLGYFPTKAEFPKGAYGPNASFFREDSEDALITALKNGLAELRVGNPEICTRV